MARNPVMFVVEVGSVLTTLRLVQRRRRPAAASSASSSRSRSGSGSPCSSPTSPRRWPRAAARRRPTRCGGPRPRRSPTASARTARYEVVPAPSLRKGDIVRVAAGEVIPADGEIIEGVASVDESAITGESAPVIRESGGDRSAVTGGTQGAVRLDSRAGHRRIPGETFLDRMIALVEGAERQKTPNEIALNILLAGLTIVFLIAVVTLQPFAIYSGAPQSVFVLVVAARLPHPDDDRRPAVGDRHRRHGPARAAQRARDVGPRGRGRRRRPHAAARQDRHDHARQPPGDRVHPAARRQRGGARRRGAAGVAARRDAGGPLDRRAREGASTACAAASCRREQATFVPFTAQTRMSGVDLHVHRRDRRTSAFARSARAPPTPSRSGSRPGAAPFRRSSPASWSASPAPAARRSSSPTARRRSASST